MINLKIEARTSDTPLLQYVVTSYNSREEWIPRSIMFRSKDNLKEPIIIDGPSLFCKERFGYQIGFRFTNMNIDTLLQTIANMSEQQVKD